MKTKSTMRAACVVAMLFGASNASAQTTTSPTTSPSESSSTTPSTTPSTTTTTTATTTTTPSTTTTTATTTPSTTTTATTTPSTTHRAPAASTVSTTTPSSAAPAPAPAPPREQGDGRDVDFLWIEGFGGISYVDLVAFSGPGNFSGTSTAGVFNETSGTGGIGGAALGFRVYWVAIGARASYAAYNMFQIGTVGGEIALRLPIPVVEPYARVGFGYAWQGNASGRISTGGVMDTGTTTTVYGWAFNAAVGFDIFVVNWFTIGAGVGLDVLNMTRQRDPRATCMGVTDFCPSRQGDAVGYQLSGFAQIGFHF